MTILVKTSSNLNIYWNFGSLLIFIIPIQILIGFILSISYFSKFNDIYYNSFNIFLNLNYGWIYRIIHSNLTSFIFIIIFIHITRSLIYKNLINKIIWNSGILILILIIAISFLGYSLINRQISFWARIVITNFISTIPIIGIKLIYLIWGNPYINNILLNRFLSLHFILALILIIISIIHVIILHKNKSLNRLNLNNNIDQINLNPLLIFKDILILFILFFIIIIINLLIPIKINNPDNFNQILIFKTPNHIEPEWYFLFFYSILRSIDDKFIGLIIIIISILILLMLPQLFQTKFISNKFLIINKLVIFFIILNISIITFIGSKTSKSPYIKIVKILIIIYFIIFYIIILISKIFK